MIAETGIEEFFRAFHAIQVEVKQLDRLATERERVGLAQCVGRTFDMALVAGGMQQRARQRSLASTYKSE